MIFITIAQILTTLSRVLTLLVLVQVVLSYFMDSYHPVRSTLDRLIAPLLDPIRRVVPPIAMMDFSPLILIILVQLMTTVLVNLLYSMAR